MNRAIRYIACLFTVWAIVSLHGFAVGNLTGKVTFAGVPVPGATITATQGDKKVVSATDLSGVYQLTDLADGVWTIRVEMHGFETASQDITIPADAPPTFQLKLLGFDEIVRDLPVQRPEPSSPAPQPAAAAPATPPRPGTSASASRTPPANSFQRAGVNAQPAAPAAPADSAAATASASAASPANAAAPAGNDPSADGLLVNGSVNNGGASPFSQLAAFGNNRRNTRSLYNWGLGLLFGNSALNARPFSFTNQETPQPSYNNVQVVGTFGGPLKIPGISQKRPNLTLSFQQVSNNQATTMPGLVPTALERSGDFSQTLNALGQPVTIINPATGLPFPGNVIPSQQISPQAAALLALYPQPNLAPGSGFNYQTPVLVATHTTGVTARLTEGFNNKNQAYGTISYQRTTTDSGNLFGFTDASRVVTFDTNPNWSHRFSQFLNLRVGYRFTDIVTDTTPYFSGVTNVSGNAGIAGNNSNQDPANWGPPNLQFSSSGIAGLSSAPYAANHDLTNGWNAESIWSHGRHNITFGGDFRLLHHDVVSPQNQRGTFAFTGAATGSDFADFLLGLPHSSAIASGNADTSLRNSTADAYVTDDWRINPTLTANVGVRWEYEAPMTEAQGRLANLDVAPGFTAVSPVLASNPTGTLTGQHYTSALLNPDRRGIEPRLALAWRPIPGSSLVVRAGYGIYRNTNVYQSIALLMAQQPPLTTSLSVTTSPANPLTLANGFVAPPNSITNTFAVDPNFRVGFAQNWQVSVQRDLPASLTMTATYLGTAGSHLMQETLPNTYPIGAVNPCPTCPAGFVYLTSNGTSEREAGTFQLRRRLRNGFTAQMQYTLSKATDDATAFGGASLSGSAIAQDWLNLDAERGPSNFDQRHAVTAQVQYTTGQGLGGGAMMTGLKGTLFKGWTVTSQLTAGSGLPVTPVFFTSVPGTGITGSIRPNVTGSTAPVDSGSYANPAAFSAPAAGQWGNAGRNSLRGPAQFSLNAGLQRDFSLGQRLTLAWRFDATNVLNRVTYGSIYTTVGSPEFGLPNQINAARKIASTLRLRF